MKFTLPWSEGLHDAGTPVVSSRELAELILEEIREVRYVLGRLQQKYCAMEKLLFNCSKSHGMEGRQEPVKLVRQPTRIFYNSSRKGSRELSQKQCNWCGRAGHVERDCWTKKGVCNLCGEDKHLLTECSKYVPRLSKRLVVPKCPACGGKHGGQDCPHRASSLSDLGSSTTISDVFASRHTQMTCKVPDKRYGSRNCDFSDTSCYSREFQQINQSTVAQNKTEQEEQLLDDSVCFKSKDKIPNYVLEDSLIF